VSSQTVIKRPIFLQAEWRHLIMMNSGIDPGVLKPLVPSGTELDFYREMAFVSVVGFRFLRTRVFGWPIPFHRNFEEVNLRFYVRKRIAEGWRRGVVFIKELVPRRAIALVARTIYGEPYVALPMRHEVEVGAGRIRVSYDWKREGKWEFIRGRAEGEPAEIETGSQEEFITEHYWGYTARKGGGSEYEVEHPRWRVWQSVEARLQADVASLYGKVFERSLSSAPLSAFIAEGSAVTVRRANGN
jgi:uncharacterized protein YqjF (DUF2071 family)